MGEAPESVIIKACDRLSLTHRSCLLSFVRLCGCLSSSALFYVVCVCASVVSGTSFQPVLGEADVDAMSVTKIILCSGKVCTVW